MKTSSNIARSAGGDSLADVLERVLDKGIVIAGDISVSVSNTELLNIKIRLLISSVERAKEMGINWWEGDPSFSSQNNSLVQVNQKLLERVTSLESEIEVLKYSQ